jgi:anti-sigma factor RsiW
MSCNDYRDLVAADVDGELSGAEAAAAAAHLAGCPRCRALRAAQAEVRTLVRSRAARHPAPTLVRARVAAAIERESTPSLRRRPSLRPWRLVIGGAVAASLAIALAALLWPAAPDLLAVMAADVHDAEAGVLALRMTTAKPEELRRFYQSRVDLPFEESVEDLSGAGFRLVGGRAANLAAAPTTLTLYEGGAGKVVCRRFRAGAVALPEGGETIGGMEVFSTGDVTIRVARLKNDVICVLASTMPRAEFLRLFAGH